MLAAGTAEQRSHRVGGKRSPWCNRRQGSVHSSQVAVLWYACSRKFGDFDLPRTSGFDLLARVLARGIAVVVAIVGASTGSGPAVNAADQPRPHVLLIMSDDLNEQDETTDELRQKAIQAYFASVSFMDTQGCLSHADRTVWRSPSVARRAPAGGAVQYPTRADSLPH